MVEVLHNNAPQSIEAEQALLSAILLNNKEIERVSEFLEEKHFADSIHGKIYAACLKLIDKGHLADPITLNDYFSALGESEQVGKDYLLKLATSNISGVNIQGYGKLIYDRAIRRELISLGHGIVSEAMQDDLETSADKQIENAEQKLYDLATVGTSDGELSSLKSSLDEALQNAEYALKNKGGISGVSSGLKDLDKVIAGFNSSDLIILAGRPGMGKTLAALNFAFNIANEVSNNRAPEKLRGPVAFFSLEMSADQLATRVLSMASEIPGYKFRQGNITPEEFQRATEMSRALDSMPLFIDDTPGISISSIRTRARRLKRIHGHLGCIIVDYLQLLSASGGRSENRVQEISAMSRGLKILAKELDTPVIALSQLSRQVEQREDKRPVLSDLRESGSIEQDADIVMFVYRAHYYLTQEEPQEGNVDFGGKTYEQAHSEWSAKVESQKHKLSIIIGKNRHGESKTVNVFADMEKSKMGDLLK